MRKYSLATFGLLVMATSLSAQGPHRLAGDPVPTLAAPPTGNGDMMAPEYGYPGELPERAPNLQGLLPEPQYLGYGGPPVPVPGDAFGPYDEFTEMRPCPADEFCPSVPHGYPVVPMQASPQFAVSPPVHMAAGYPFYRAPLPASSMAMHSVGHTIRKRAFFHHSPGNMIPSRPIYPVSGGSYYFRPYTYGAVYDHQAQAAIWGMHPGFPYAEISSAAMYQLTNPFSGHGALTGQDPSARAVPSRAFQTYDSSPEQ